VDSLDEQLRLMCFCCHPALTERVQILLTLKLVGGLATDEIAAALVMKPKTVGQALTRAKEKIKRAGIPFHTPDHSHLPERIEAIRAIIYLLFNEGYHSNSEHSLYRFDLCNEAIRLIRLLYSINRHDHDSASLLALLLFQNSRSKARSSMEGEPILLKDQNRKLWNTGMIDEACGIFDRLLKNMPDPPGQYFFQAAIAREYAIAPSFEESNWTKICHIFAELYYLKPDPIVLLSWVTAESYRSNPETALNLMESFNLQHFLKDYRWFYSARGELQAQTGKYESAMEDIAKALALTQNPGEKRLLERRMREIEIIMDLGSERDSD
jgi:RNA polymerase sigma-70 factor, ECF subfamily